MLVFLDCLVILAIFLLGCVSFCLVSLAQFTVRHGLHGSAIWQACVPRPAHFPWRVLLCALSGGLLAVLCAFRFGINATALVNFAFLGVLTAVSLSDSTTMEIPDSYVLAAAMVGTLSILTCPDVSPLSRLIGVFAVSVPLTLIALVVPGGFGGGDIKLMAACGWMLGWRLVLLSALLGILLGGVYGAAVLLLKKRGRRDAFAFGPFLCAGMALCVFFGGELSALYFRLFDLSRFF